MNTLTNGSPLDDSHKNTIKSHEIKIGNSFCIGEQNSAREAKIDVTDEGFLHKLTPELSNKIRETIYIAEQKAKNIIAEATAQGEVLRQQAQEKGLQEGIKRGENQGYQDGINQATNEFIEKTISLDRFLNNILNAKTQIYHSGEAELVEFVMIIAEKLAHTQIQIDPDALKNIIIDASVELKEKESLKVLIHPSMAKKIYSISDEIKNAIYGLKNLRIIEDRTISPDGTVIESPDSRVDARLSTQVGIMLEKLLKEINEKPLLKEEEISDDKLD